MSKTEELLAVLDMTEEKQWEWVDENCELEGWVAPISKSFVPTESLADLAFRLRDEAEPYEFDTGLFDIYEYLLGKEDEDAKYRVFGFWKSGFAKPIHWIIAALIAKQKEKEDGKP